MYQTSFLLLFLFSEMSCLLSFLDEDPNALTQMCRGMLKKRKEMWEYAAQVTHLVHFSVKQK
jgi:hypothetical protein